MNFYSNELQLSMNFIIFNIITYFIRTICTSIILRDKKFGRYNKLQKTDVYSIDRSFNYNKRICITR